MLCKLEEQLDKGYLWSMIMDEAARIAMEDLVLVKQQQQLVEENQYCNNSNQTLTNQIMIHV
jgi:hypothetical protein